MCLFYYYFFIFKCKLQRYKIPLTGREADLMCKGEGLYLTGLGLEEAELAEARLKR